MEKEKKKFSLKKTIALVVLVATAFSFGAKKHNKKVSNIPTTSYSYSSKSSIDTATEHQTEERIYSTLDEIENVLSSKAIISDSGINNLSINLENFDIAYQYEDMYDFDQADKMSSTLNEDAFSHKSDIIGSDMYVSSNELYNQVKINNKDYLESSKKQGNILFVKELDDDLIRKACDIIAETINKDLQTNKYLRINELSCVLGDLKIFKQSIPKDDAHVDQDNCLCISPETNRLTAISEGLSLDEMFKRIIEHETHHLEQEECICNDEEDSWTMGFCTEYNNLNVNSMFWKWYIEASAENLVCAKNGVSSIYYKNLVGYLRSMDLATILNPNNGVNEVTKASVSKDINHLYNAFSCSNDFDRQNINKMMYTTEIMQLDDSDFYEANPSLDFETSSSERLDFQDRIKPSICATYAKSFYSDLVNQLASNDVSIKDVFYLIRIIEGDATYHMYLDEDSKRHYADEYINKACELRSEIFGLISENSQFTKDDLESTYLSYSPLENGKISSNSFDLNWMSQEKKEWLRNYGDSISGFLIPLTKNQTSKTLNK